MTEESTKMLFFVVTFISLKEDNILKVWNDSSENISEPHKNNDYFCFLYCVRKFSVQEL